MTWLLNLLKVLFTPIIWLLKTLKWLWVAVLTIGLPVWMTVMVSFLAAI